MISPEKNRLCWSDSITFLLLFFAVTAAISCSPRTGTISSPVDYQENFFDSGIREIPGHWWTVFGDNRLNALVALTEEQQLRRDLLSEELCLLEFRISLYRALAGTFRSVPLTLTTERFFCACRNASGRISIIWKTW